MKKLLLLKSVLLLCALIVGSGSGWAETTETYTFTTAKWAATLNGSSANWTSGKDGAGFSNNGVQVTTNSTGANATSPKSFDNISKIVVTYNTNTSKGAGTLAIQIGSNTAVTKNWAYSTGTGTSANYKLQFDYDTPQSGNVKITANTTTNSIYVVSIAITYTPAASFNLTATSSNDSYGTVSVSGSTITAAPADGYRVSTSNPYTVTSGEATVTQDENSFSVSADADCTVRINFEAIPTHTVTCNAATNGSVSADLSTAGEGATVTLTTTPATGYETASITVVDANENTVTVTNTATNTYTFNMPTSDVTVTATFANFKTDILTTSLFGSPSSYTTWSGKSYTGGSEAIYAGQSTGGSSYIQLRATSPSGIVSTTSGGKVRKITVSWNSNTTNGRTITVYGKNTAYKASSELYTDTTRGTELGTITYGTNTELTISGDYEYVGLLPGGGAMYLNEIDITWEPNAPTYTINFAAVPIAGGTVTVLDDNADEVTSGDKFEEGTELTIEAAANEGYSFSSWTATGVSLSDDQTSNNELEIAMPAAAVNLTANFTLNNYALNLTHHNGTVAVTVDDEEWDGTNIDFGSTVSITATPDANYLFSSWTTDDVTLDDTSASTIEFTMPAKAVSITANFAAASTEYDINIVDATGGTITADKAKAKAGETVTLSYSLTSEDYAFGAWDVTDEASNPITVSYDEENEKYTFTMPAMDVLVSATYKDVYTVTYFVADQQNTARRADGDALSLDDADEMDGMAFAGWSTTADVANPSFMATTDAVTGDITLYAMFVAAEGVSGYYRVTEELTDWRGDYLIAYSSTIFADGRTSGTDGIGKQDTKASPGGKLKDEVVDVTWGDTYNVTLEAINDTDLSKGYVLKTKDGYYNYQSSDGNGISTTANKSTAADYPITVQYKSSSEINLTLSSGPVFRYNSNDFIFRFYKSSSYTNQKAVYLYKKSTSTPTYSLGTKAITISAAGWASFSCASEVAIPEGVTAYYAQQKDETTITLKEIDGGYIPANTGVVVSGAANSYAATITATDATLEGTNLLQPWLTAGTPDAETYYTLAVDNSNNPVFKESTGGTLAAGKAYLVLPSGVNVRELSVVFDSETTGITSTAMQSSTGQYYDLQGRRIAQPAKGLYIVNGRKVVIR